MKVTGLDDKIYTWNFTKYKQKSKCSKLHARARNVLVTQFPCDIIYEELTLPGTKDERQIRPLRADFFVPSHKLIVEVQGEQHYKFNNFFFKDKLDFYRAQNRDRQKAEWCNINNFLIIYFIFNETDKQWLDNIKVSLW